MIGVGFEKTKLLIDLSGKETLTTDEKINGIEAATTVLTGILEPEKIETIVEAIAEKTNDQDSPS